MWKSDILKYIDYVLSSYDSIDNSYDKMLKVNYLKVIKKSVVHIDENILSGYLKNAIKKQIFKDVQRCAICT